MLRPIFQNLSVIFILLGLLILLKLLSLPAVKGWIGEKLVVRGLSKKLDQAVYRHFHDLYLPRPDGQGTTQIDHVVASPFGIFVIETKNYRGWIFGSEKQRDWTQQIYRKKSRFQNPLHQNQLHVRALAQFLGLPEERFLPVVYFAGNSEFKTAMPRNVLNRGLIAWIKSHSAVRLDNASIQRSNLLLDQLNLTTDRKTVAAEHRRSLLARNR